MLPEIDALPGPQRALALAYRKRERGLGENTADMRRHVVFALVNVFEERIAIWNQSRCEAL